VIGNIRNYCFPPVFLRYLIQAPGMKRFLFIILLLPGCSINRLTDRMEIPANQVWDLYTALHVIKVDSFRLKRYHLITANPYGKTYPKYTYQWHDYDHVIRVGDIVPLTDSLRSQLVYKQNWKRSVKK